MKVYVISQSGRPLMPTERFGRVRRLLKSGRAKVVSRKPFTIQLLYETTEIVQPLALGIDTGTNHIGIAVTKEDGTPVFMGELETRTREVTGNMEERCQHRKARRRHKRDKRKRRAVKAGTVFKEKEYRINGCEKIITCKFIRPGIIRFENRKRTDKWLTPTCTHLLETHINFVKKTAKILPISQVNLEYAKFDIHKLDNPDVKGIEYQNGRKKGYTNSSEFVLCRDKHTCQLCKRKTGLMKVHHVIWQCNGGSHLPENLVTLCDKCHDKVHLNPKMDKKVNELFKGIKKRYVHTTILNSIMPEFHKWLCENFGNVKIVYGYETKDIRRKFGLPKEHCTDAYIISLNDEIPVKENPGEVFTFKQFRRHNRSIIMRQEDRKYYIGRQKIAVNRNRRTGQTSDSLKDLIDREGESFLNKLTVRPAARPKRSIKSFGMGDTVRYEGEIKTIRGFTGNYIGFIGDKKYNKNMKKAELMLKNQGICCI
jgi:hypothetical protein